MPGPQSGVLVYGEQRAAAAADFDRDGRVDLLVTQNRAESKLYRNVKAKPGWRVRLNGVEGNATGVGAVLRVLSGTHSGPALEIHAGAGYWSQDSPVLIVSGARPGDQLLVRWPGGKTSTSTLPAQVSEISVDPTGRLRVLKPL